MKKMSSLPMLSKTSRKSLKPKRSVFAARNNPGQGGSLKNIPRSNLNELYEAKCKDLKIHVKEDQVSRFFKYCNKVFDRRSI